MQKITASSRFYRRVRELAAPAACLAALAAAPCARAQLTAYEGFNYSAGADLSGASGGFGWSGGWTGSAPYSFQIAEASSLVYGGAATGYVASSGGAAYFGPTGSVSGLSFRRNLAVPLGATSGTWYVSFLMDFDSSAEMLVDFNTGSGAWGFSVGVFYPYLDRIGMQRGLSGAVLGTANMTTNLYVLKLDLGGGSTTGTSRVTAYLNPRADGTSMVASGMMDNLSSFDVGSIGLTSRGGNIHLDEIRFGTTLASVMPVAAAVPEPCAAAALTGGVVALAAGAARRRRRAGGEGSP